MNDSLTTLGEDLATMAAIAALVVVVIALKVGFSMWVTERAELRKRTLKIKSRADGSALKRSKA